MDKESFVTGSETNALVINVFTGLGLAALGMIFTFLFFWSYNKDKTVFIVVLSVILFLYALMQMIYFIVKKESLGNVEFSIMLGASIFVEIMAVILLIIFSIIASRRLRGSTVSSSSFSQAPAPQTF
jgi:uncharacterized membrane protein